MKLTKTWALRTLITYASKWAAGCGVGLRATLTEDDRKKIAVAVLILYKDAYRRYPVPSDLFNLGLTSSEESLAESIKELQEKGR
jgi:hypothetical protein